MDDRLTFEGLVGTWDRPELALLGDDGDRLEFPAASGRLVYSADGFMIAVVALERPATTESGGELMGAFLSYTGRFEIRSDGWVQHHVDVSLPTEWTGTTVRRRAIVRPGAIDLATPAMPTRGGARFVRCSWHRVHAGDPAARASSR